MTRAKLAFVGFVAAGNSMWHKFLDDAKVSASLSQVSPQRHATLSYAPNSTQYNSVLQSSEKCYPSTILYYKVLVLLRTTKYYSSTTSISPVLQSTTPVLLRTTKYQSSTTKYFSSTTKYYSSTTPYAKVLLQYYSSTTSYYKVSSPVLQSTTPVLRTTKYYSSTTSCYKALVQYYSVLQSATPVLLRTTKY